MKESEIERYFVWIVQSLGGTTYKFRSPTQRGVADRIACMPDGDTWFVELKTKGGRLAPLQKLFAADMQRLGQRYACLWSTEGVDEWASHYDLIKKKLRIFYTSETGR
jgi:hypothetical protein